MTLTKLRYFLFLLINVVFIFLFASTYWQLVRDLANAPMKIPEKLAAALQQGTARYAPRYYAVNSLKAIWCRHFFLSYVMLQGRSLRPRVRLQVAYVTPSRYWHHATPASQSGRHHPASVLPHVHYANTSRYVDPLDPE